MPNKATFLSIFLVYSPASIVNEARKIFDSISIDYGLEKNAWLDSIVFDLLGRIDNFKRIQELLEGCRHRTIFPPSWAYCVHVVYMATWVHKKNYLSMHSSLIPGGTCLYLNVKHSCQLWDGVVWLRGENLCLERRATSSCRSSSGP